LPRGGGSLAIIRWLISEFRLETAVRVTDVARAAGVTQPRASQVLAALERLHLVRRRDRPGNRRWMADPDALLDAFLHEYRGPGGFESYYYSLEPPLSDVKRLSRLSGTSRFRFAVSADVGPDLLAPCRRPEKVIIYADGPTPFAELTQSAKFHKLQWVRAAGTSDANIIVREAADPSVFGFGLEAEIQGCRIPLAHPSQMIRDLHDLGESDDRIEAAGLLKEWLLKDRRMS
jgi:hypothetical protein